MKTLRRTLQQAFVPVQHGLALFLVIALMVSSLPEGVFAQTNVRNEETPTASEPAEWDYGRLDSVEQLQEQVSEATPPPSSPPAPEVEENPVMETTESAPADPLPAMEPTQVAEQANLQSARIQLDVSVPEFVRSNALITYTFRYTNTSGAVLNSGIRLDVNWSDLASFNPRQTCNPCSPVRLSGPEVVGGANVPTFRDPTARYTIGALGVGQNGAFEVGLFVTRDAYPQSGREIVRLAGSGQIFLGSETAPAVEDTAQATVVGPVLSLSKATISPVPIYSANRDGIGGETVSFEITVGNATAPTDRLSDGRPRPDARDATNVVVREIIPTNTQLVEPVPTPPGMTVNIVRDGANQPTAIEWRFLSLPAANDIPSSTRSGMRFELRKIDSQFDCGVINNNKSSYTVTSDEYPLVNATERQVVRGSLDVSVPVISNYLSIPNNAVTQSPSRVIYGNLVTINIRVDNFWNQAASGVQVEYAVPSNMTYVPDNPLPPGAPVFQGVVGQPGGLLRWTFTAAAGSKQAATPTFLSARLRAGFTHTVTAGGTIQLTPPEPLPNACLSPVNGFVVVDGRLQLSKVSTNPDLPNRNGTYIVRNGDTFAYTIEIKNDSIQAAQGVTVRDLLPNGLLANFSYVAGSARLNGDPIADPVQDTIQDGASSRTRLTWQVNAPGVQVSRLTYQMRVGGVNYVNYCNLIEASLNEETITYGSKIVCVKINPQVRLTKTIASINGQPGSTLVAQPGDLVRFRLTMQNLDPQPQKIGLADSLGGFEFVNSESGYGPIESQTATTIQWPIRELQQNQLVEVVFTARVPNVCQSVNYVNRALFWDQFGLITPDQQAIAVAQVNCVLPINQVEYTVNADRSTISLRDRVTFTLTIRNRNTTLALNNVGVRNVLPRGFNFERMATNSQLRTDPNRLIRPDDRRQLTWTIPSVAPNQTFSIVFVARGPGIVFDGDNWMTITGLQAPRVAVCQGRCEKRTEDNTELAYSMVGISITPLITTEPRILNNTACTEPGDRRTYQLSVVNTNSVRYTDTRIDVSLPFGLRYVRPLSNTPAPSVIANNDGTTTLQWSNLFIDSKPNNAIAFVLALEVELQAGQVYGSLPTQVQTTSPDGDIPRKDGISDPVVQMCSPMTPAVAKEVNKQFVRNGEEIVYEISLANPGNTPLNVTVRDQLPGDFRFLSMVAGAEPVRASNDQLLTWNNVSVPAAANNRPGIVSFRFRVQAIGSRGVFTNTAQVPGSQFDTRFSSVDVFFSQGIYLPLVMR